MAFTLKMQSFGLKLVQLLKLQMCKDYADQLLWFKLL